MTNPTGPDYRDRRVGLVVFGVVELLIGLLCALFVPLILVGLALKPAGAPSPQHSLVPAMAIYAILAVAFVWLGIGSILARRWARAILLCLSGVGLCVGILASVWIAFMMPHLMQGLVQQNQAALPPAAIRMMKIIILITLAVIYIIIPGALFLFYRSPHVKRTCEVCDPVERWTDRCPLPVLALSLVAALGGIFVLALMGSVHGFPVFGVVVSGGAGVVVFILLAGLLLWVARGLYQLRIGAWWVALGLQVIGAASNAVTFWRVDLADLYAKMGYDSRTAAIATQILAHPAMRWMTVISILPWLVWLFCIRRYFGTPTAAPPLIEANQPG